MLTTRQYILGIKKVAPSFLTKTKKNGEEKNESQSTTPTFSNAEADKAADEWLAKEADTIQSRIEITRYLYSHFAKLSEEYKKKAIAYFNKNFKKYSIQDKKYIYELITKNYYYPEELKLLDSCATLFEKAEKKLAKVNKKIQKEIDAIFPSCRK